MFCVKSIGGRLRFISGCQILRDRIVLIGKDCVSRLIDSIVIRFGLFIGSIIRHKATHLLLSLLIVVVVHFLSMLHAFFTLLIDIMCLVFNF